MASNYPGSLDTFDAIASDKKTSDSVGGRTHRDMHNDLGDAVEAVQAELGTDPAGTFATVKARLDALVAYAAKTGAYTATVADHTLNVTSGTFTLDLPAASTCTGQSLKVKNSGTGVVTLDGNSSETVESVATFPLGPGSYVEITSTGSAWILTGGTPDTGWRNVTAAMDATFKTNRPNGSLYLRRRGDLCEARFIESGTPTATSGLIYDLPDGFWGSATSKAATVMLNANTVVGTTASMVVTYTSGQWLYCADWTTVPYLGSLMWTTKRAWPTSLPGTAA